jgi:hypothetical protein
MYEGREFCTGFWWGKRSHRRHRCRLKDNVIIEFHKVEFVGMDWICLAQDNNRWRAVVNTLIKLLVLQKQGNS